jgi:hypothetical protein
MRNGYGILFGKSKGENNILRNINVDRIIILK